MAAVPNPAMSIFPTLEVESLVGRVDYNSRDVLLLDTAYHKSFGDIKPLSINQDGAVMLPDIQEKECLDLPHGRLRVVLAMCEQLRHVIGAVRPGKMPLQHQITRPAWTFPFSEATLDDLVRKMHLPQETPARISWYSPTPMGFHFQSQPLRGIRKRLGITMKFSDSAIVGVAAALALSHCEKTNLTEGIVLCTSETELRTIAEKILSARSLAAHPAALPIIICGFFSDLLDRKIEETWQETFQLETDGGQSGIFLAADGTVLATGNPFTAKPREETDDVELEKQSTARHTGSRITIKALSSPTPSHATPRKSRDEQLALNTRSIGLAQLALAWEHYTNVNAILVGLVEKFIKSRSIPDNTVTGSAEPSMREKQQIALEERVEILSQCAKSSTMQASYQRGRLELQNTAVNNLLALELGKTNKSIAVASWMEGTAMKYLAILGLVFLPAACIAAIFTVPDEMVTNYWITTSVATILMIGVCIPVVRVRLKMRTLREFDLD